MLYSLNLRFRSQIEAQCRQSGARQRFNRISERVKPALLPVGHVFERSSYLSKPIKAQNGRDLRRLAFFLEPQGLKKVFLVGIRGLNLAILLHGDSF